MRTKDGAVGSTVIAPDYLCGHCSLALLALQLFSHYSSHMFYLCRLYSVQLCLGTGGTAKQRTIRTGASERCRTWQWTQCDGLSQGAER